VMYEEQPKLTYVNLTERSQSLIVHTFWWQAVSSEKYTASEFANSELR